MRKAATPGVLVLAAMVVLWPSSCGCPGPGGDDAGDGGGDGGAVDAGLIWPNGQSSANSDPWLVANHQLIGQLQPKVLVVNFVNGFTDAQVTRKFSDVARAYREATRYHATVDPEAIPFIEFQLARVVNLRDNPVPSGYQFENSTRYPRTSTTAPFTWMDYGAFFSAAFASHYGYSNDAGGHYTLCELIDRGLVNELWFIGSGDVPDSAAYESLESKQRYNVSHNKLDGSFDRCAGNGCFDVSVPVCNRSVRIAFINYNRGGGCFLESLGHSFEGMANNGSLPWLRPYFREFGGFDLDTRYGVPFNSWYACSTPGCVTYSNVTATGMSAAWSVGAQTGTIASYLPACGNAHFPPNGRQHYDITNPQSVPSTCAHYRMRDAPDGGDLIDTYSGNTVAGFFTLAPDCTGAWEVYWRQSFPGRQNLARDDAGQPMLNWWPFLYY